MPTIWDQYSDSELIDMAETPSLTSLVIDIDRELIKRGIER
jgi:hypothetical protein